LDLELIIVFFPQRWVNLMWLEIDAGREACWKDRPLPQDLQAGDQHRTSDSIMCLCEVGPYNSHWWRLDVNLVVVPSELLEKWMNEWNAGYEESCPRCRTDSSVCHQDIACSFRKPKIDDRPKCVANEREKPVIDQQRAVFVTTSGPFEEYVVKEI